MSHTRSSGLLHQAGTLFGSGVVAGLSDAELLERFTARSAGGPGLVAMFNYGRRKQCEVRDDLFHGPPNFVLDVFCTTDDPDFFAAAIGSANPVSTNTSLHSTTSRSGCSGIAWTGTAIGWSSPMRTGHPEPCVAEISGLPSGNARARLVDRARLHREGCVAPRELRLTRLRRLQPSNAGEPAVAERGCSGWPRRRIDRNIRGVTSRPDPLGTLDPRTIVSDRRFHDVSEVSDVGQRRAGRFVSVAARVDGLRKLVGFHDGRIRESFGEGRRAVAAAGAAGPRVRSGAAAAIARPAVAGAPGPGLPEAPTGIVAAVAVAGDDQRSRRVGDERRTVGLQTRAQRPGRTEPRA